MILQAASWEKGVCVLLSHLFWYDWMKPTGKHSSYVKLGSLVRQQEEQIPVGVWVYRNLFEKTKIVILLLMAEILHHLGCIKPYK